MKRRSQEILDWRIYFPRVAARITHKLGTRLSDDDWRRLENACMGYDPLRVRALLLHAGYRLRRVNGKLSEIALSDVKLDCTS